jgi:hypothetical protein
MSRLTTRALVPAALAALCLWGLQGCGGAAAPAEDAPDYTPVASIDQVMDGIVIPASQRVFDAVVYSNGELVAAPKTDDDWLGIQMSALAVAEAGNLLIMPGRAIDNADWVQMSRALTETAVLVAKAADARDINAVLETGGEMYAACTNCHVKYAPE